VNSYDYDANGSRIVKRNSSGSPVEAYSYDQRKLINQIATAGGTSSFHYDPNAYRIDKNTATGSNHYYLEGEHLEAVYDQNNDLKASYLRGVVVDEIINGFEKDANNKLINRSYHHDQVNSVIATTDHTGAVTQSNSYSPFGIGFSTTGADANQLKYTGRESDANGLYYYRARYYDPLAGRFLSEDPLGFSAGVNFYSYVDNNPVNNNDPSGKLALPWHFFISYNAASDSGLSFTESINIAWEATAADFGTQSQYWYDTSQHGMIGLYPVGSWDDVSITYIYQTPEQALDGANQLIDYNLGLGTAQGYGTALHALQDLEVPLHQGHTWTPGLSWENTVHYYNDIFPSFDTISNAYNSSLDALGGSAPANTSNEGSYWGGLGQGLNAGIELYPNTFNLNTFAGVYSK
jgi:RHS repeat-associated protein